jgi:DNA-binding GntR family transcriptional regulator
VEVVDNSGAFVPELSLKTVLDAYDLREALEGVAVRLCCDCAGRQDIRELKLLAQRFYESEVQSKQKKQNVDNQLNALDRQLHARFLEISQNKMIQQVAYRYHILDAIWAPNDRGIQMVHDEHMAIIQAISDNQPELAERLTRQHIHAGKQSLEQQISSGNFKLAWGAPNVAG